MALDRCTRKIDMLTRWGGGRFGSVNLKIVVTRFGIFFELEEEYISLNNTRVAFMLLVFMLTSV